LTLIVVCFLSIGKSTLAKKNNLFIDLDGVFPDEKIIIDKKEHFLLSTEEIKDKILLINKRKTFFENLNNDYRVVYLDIEKISSLLLKRAVRKFLKRKKANKEKIISFLEETKFEMNLYIKQKKDFNNIIELNYNNINNLEEILINYYKEINNVKNE
jgi:hypothetical protein